MGAIKESKAGGFVEGDSDEYDSEGEVAADVEEEDEINFDLLEVSTFENVYHKVLLK
jgi:hypothetical protein